jgi:anti-sigma regulatory factor (Ser/Thr protein kinase)
MTVSPAMGKPSAVYFPRDPRGPAVARTTLKAVLGAHGPGEFTDRAELLTSELATNAVRHSLGPATVRLNWANPVLRVSVTDTCPLLPAPPVPGGPDAEGGQGLLILELLADDWGGCLLGESVFGVGGKSVWFELRLGGGDPSAGAVPGAAVPGRGRCGGPLSRPDLRPRCGGGWARQG